MQSSGTPSYTPFNILRDRLGFDSLLGDCFFSCDSKTEEKVDLAFALPPSHRQQDAEEKESIDHQETTSEQAEDIFAEKLQEFLASEKGPLFKQGVKNIIDEIKSTIDAWYDKKLITLEEKNNWEENLEHFYNKKFRKYSGTAIFINKTYHLLYTKGVGYLQVFSQKIKDDSIPYALRKTVVGNLLTGDELDRCGVAAYAFIKEAFDKLATDAGDILRAIKCSIAAQLAQRIYQTITKEKLTQEESQLIKEKIELTPEERLFFFPTQASLEKHGVTLCLYIAQKTLGIHQDEDPFHEYFYGASKRYTSRSVEEKACIEKCRIYLLSNFYYGIEEVFKLEHIIPGLLEQFDLEGLVADFQAAFLNIKTLPEEKNDPILQCSQYYQMKLRALNNKLNQFGLDDEDLVLFDVADDFSRIQLVPHAYEKLKVTLIHRLFSRQYLNSERRLEISLGQNTTFNLLLGDKNKDLSYVLIRTPVGCERQLYLDYCKSATSEEKDKLNSSLIKYLCSLSKYDNEKKEALIFLLLKGDHTGEVYLQLLKEKHIHRDHLNFAGLTPFKQAIKKGFWQVIGYYLEEKTITLDAGERNELIELARKNKELYVEWSKKNPIIQSLFLCEALKDKELCLGLLQEGLISPEQYLADGIPFFLALVEARHGVCIRYIIRNDKTISKNEKILILMCENDSAVKYLLEETYFFTEILDSLLIKLVADKKQLVFEYLFDHFIRLDLKNEERNTIIFRVLLQALQKNDEAVIDHIIKKWYHIIPGRHCIFSVVEGAVTYIWESKYKEFLECFNKYPCLYLLLGGYIKYFFPSKNVLEFSLNALEDGHLNILLYAIDRHPEEIIKARVTGQEMNIGGMLLSRLIERMLQLSDTSKIYYQYLEIIRRLLAKGASTDPSHFSLITDPTKKNQLGNLKPIISNLVAWPNVLSSPNTPRLKCINLIRNQIVNQSGTNWTNKQPTFKKLESSLDDLNTLTSGTSDQQVQDLIGQVSAVCYEGFSNERNVLLEQSEIFINLISSIQKTKENFKNINPASAGAREAKRDVPDSLSPSSSALVCPPCSGSSSSLTSSVDLKRVISDIEKIFGGEENKSIVSTFKTIYRAIKEGTTTLPFFKTYSKIMDNPHLTLADIYCFVAGLKNKDERDCIKKALQLTCQYHSSSLVDSSLVLSIHKVAYGQSNCLFARTKVPRDIAPDNLKIEPGTRRARIYDVLAAGNVNDRGLLLDR